MENKNIMDFVNIFNIKKGSRIIKIKRIYGKTKLITAGKVNQGYKQNIDISSSKNILFQEPCLTIDMFGNVFFRDYKFAADDNVHILTFKEKFIKKYKNINIENAYKFFITPLKYLVDKKYGYGRQVRIKRLRKEKIINILDFGWDLNKKIKKWEKINLSFDIPKSKEVLNLNNYKLFNIKDLFNISGTKSTKKEIIYNGTYLYITTSNKNNGCLSTSHTWTEKSNVITIDSATDAKAFYQDKSFVASDHVEKLSPKFETNKWIMLFMVTILNYSINHKYSYSRKRSQTRIKKEKLFLPSKKNGMPNFERMEKIMKKIHFSKLIENYEE